MIKIILTILIISLSSQYSWADSSHISLDEYLEQIKNNNLTYASSDEQVESSELLKKKADLITAISAFGSAQTGFNQQNQALAIFNYKQTYSQNYQLGFSQTSNLGIESKLYYSINKTTYKGLDTSRFGNPDLATSNYQTNPVLEVTLPLWKNLFGSSTKASKDSELYQNEANKLNARSLSINTLVSAEKSYWNLSATRKIVEIQKNTLKKAQEILQYVSRRASMNLGEKADVLQAKALVEQKNLELKQAQNNEEISARNFNKQRYLDSNIVAENLENLDSKRLDNLLITKVKTDNRYDVKAMEAQMKREVAAAKIEEENNKPNLNLYGAYAFKGVNGGANDALNRSFDDRGEEGLVGVKFSMPINFGLSSDIRRGAVKRASVAKINYRQKLLDQENDWNNLIQNLENYKENLQLAKNIENAQKLKLENERRLLKQGRTSTYQILLFEQEYSKSQLTTVQIANQLLGFIADKKLYQSIN